MRTLAYYIFKVERMLRRGVRCGTCAAFELQSTVRNAETHEVLARYGQCRVLRQRVADTDYCVLWMKREARE